MPACAFSVSTLDLLNLQRIAVVWPPAESLSCFVIQIPEDFLFSAADQGGIASLSLRIVQNCTAQQS